MPARKAAHSVIAAIFVNEPREALPMDQLHQLGENVSAIVHKPSLSKAILVEIRHI
jgi:hypothetical protein